VSRSVRRRKEVKNDIIELARYIARDSMDSAMRFIDAVESTLAGLAEIPGKGGRLELRDRALEDVRSYSVAGFPKHLILYRPTKAGIEVLAILHGARNIPPILRDRR
jgi:toxin ParE1/3/4